MKRKLRGGSPGQRDLVTLELTLELTAEGAFDLYLFLKDWRPLKETPPVAKDEIVEGMARLPAAKARPRSARRTK